MMTQLITRGSLQSCYAETLVSPDIVTAIEANAQAEGNKYEGIDIANVPFSITVHINNQDQFATCIMGCNTPLISFYNAMT